MIKYNVLVINSDKSAIFSEHGTMKEAVAKFRESKDIHTDAKDVLLYRVEYKSIKNVTPKKK